jgi:hypothetical protein
MRSFNWLTGFILSVLCLLLGGWMVAGATNQVPYSVAEAFLQQGNLSLNSPYLFLQECYAWFAEQPLVAGGIGTAFALAGFLWFILELAALIPKPKPEAPSDLILKSDARGEIVIPPKIVGGFIRQAVLEIQNVEDFHPHLEHSGQGLIISGVVDVKNELGSQDTQEIGAQVQASIHYVVEQQLGMSVDKTQVQLRWSSRQEQDWNVASGT